MLKTSFNRLSEPELGIMVIPSAFPAEKHTIAVCLWHWVWLIKW